MTHIDKLSPSLYIFSMKKRKKSLEIPETEPVKLKPLFGMQPGKYLTILYAFILLVLLFFLLVFPGLRKHGSKLSITSLPDGAAVYIDDTYRASTPCELFLPSGEHSIRVEKPFFSPHIETIEIPGRLFASILFPKKLKYEAQMEVENLPAYLNWRFSQAANWSLVGAFYERYPYPANGSTALKELQQSYRASQKGRSEVEFPTIVDDFVYMLSNTLNSPEMLTDYLSALQILTGDTPDTPPSFERLITEASSSNFETELLALYALLLQDESKELLPDASPEALFADLQAEIESLGFEQVYSVSNPEAGIPYRLKDHRLIQINPPAEVPLGNESIELGTESLKLEALSSFPHSEELKTYYMSRSEVSRREFLEFTEAVPEWSLENKNKLIEKGLVDEEYLAFTEVSGGDENPGLPATHVSWYAAQAYCDWLNRQLPAEMQEEYSVRLPNEAEWEYAARLNRAGRIITADAGFVEPQTASYIREGRIGLADLRGNVWEWCENWYFPSDVLDGEYGLARAHFDGVEKSVRGGSWANREAEIPVWRRASQPPSWCSPFLGFRIVLAAIE